MAKSKKFTFTCPAAVEDRAVKSGKLKLAIDPSAESFLSRSKARDQVLSMVIEPGPDHRAIKPIPLAGIVKTITLVLKDVAVPDERLAELDYLIREEHAVVTLRITGERADELFDEAPEAGA